MSSELQFGPAFEFKADLVRFATKTPTAPPAPQYYEYIPIDGAHGQAYNFTFKYRNRSEHGKD
jgi:hypothetical protein